MRSPEVHTHASAAAVAKGATFEGRLESNPSTGYSWKLDDLDATTLKLVQDGQHAAGDCPESTVGCGGTTTYRFIAVGAGDAQIKLDHVAPGSGATERSFTLRVTITG